MWDPYAEFQSEILPNGLTVYAAHWPGRPWEAMGFLVHTGAEYDPVGLEGLSHFVEHLVSENAIVSKKDMRMFFEDCGGLVNFGTTGYPYTHYRFFIPTDKVVLMKAFSMFGQMLFSAKLGKFIERERQVIIGEFHRRYPLKFVFDLDVRRHKVLYSGYWLERFVWPVGTPESVERITQTDLQLHYDTHYMPANISIVGVGGMMLSEVVELLSKSPFAISKKGVRTPLPTPATDVAPLSENRHIFEVSQYISMAAPIKIGAYRSVAKIPGNINARAIGILSNMLDEILTEEMRERHAWTYHIDTSWHNFLHFYEFSINCDALTLQAFDEIEETIEVCIASMDDRENLFKQTKQRKLVSNFMIDSTAKGICDGALDDLADHQRIISLAEYSNDIELVTMNDIHNLLQWLRPKRRWTFLVKP